MTTRAYQIECLLTPVIDYRTNSVASGYTAYFYSAGTSSAKQVWTEKEKTNPYTSRTLGSDGTAQVYGDGVYKIVIKDTDGTAVYTWDNIKVQANTFTVQTKSATYTATADDDMILCSGTFTINIATVAGFTHPLIVKRVSGTITVDPYSAETIDGSATITLSASDDSAVLYPDTVAGVWRRADSLSGLTTSVAELNLLDGLTADYSDLNQLDGVIAVLTTTNQTIGGNKTFSARPILSGVNDGTYNIDIPTNGIAAAKFMLGDSNTIAWFYLNTAPPGWKVLSTGADTVLAVAGGASQYNVSGGNPDTVNDWTTYWNHALTTSQMPVHAHSKCTDTAAAGGSISTNVWSGYTGATTPAATNTGNAGSGGTHNHGRPAASVGKLFQLDTA